MIYLALSLVKQDQSRFLDRKISGFILKLFGKLEVAALRCNFLLLTNLTNGILHCSSGRYHVFEITQANPKKDVSNYLPMQMQIERRDATVHRKKYR